MAGLAVDDEAKEERGTALPRVHPDKLRGAESDGLLRKPRSVPASAKAPPAANLVKVTVKLGRDIIRPAAKVSRRSVVSSAAPGTGLANGGRVRRLRAAVVKEAKEVKEVHPMDQFDTLEEWEAWLDNEAAESTQGEAMAVNTEAKLATSSQKLAAAAELEEWEAWLDNETAESTQGEARALNTEAKVVAAALVVSSDGDGEAQSAAKKAKKASANRRRVAAERALAPITVLSDVSPKAALKGAVALYAHTVVPPVPSPSDEAAPKKPRRVQNPAQAAAIKVAKAAKAAAKVAAKAAKAETVELARDESEGASEAIASLGEEGAAVDVELRGPVRKLGTTIETNELALLEMQMAEAEGKGLSDEQWGAAVELGLLPGARPMVTFLLLGLGFNAHGDLEKLLDRREELLSIRVERARSRAAFLLHIGLSHEDVRKVRTASRSWASACAFPFVLCRVVQAQGRGVWASEETLAPTIDV